MPAVTRRRRGEAGYVLVTVLGAMVVIALMTVAAFAAVDGDARESGKDVARKQALAAAEAGVNQYMFKLNGDNDYWAKCTTMTGTNAVNDVWNGVLPDPRKWLTVPGATTQYTIELLPANGFAKCTPGANVAASMIDADTRSLRIRVTGRAQSAKGLVTRSIVAALKRDSFLDFLWFTDYETSDPIWYSVRSNGRPTGGSQGDLMTWAANNCPEYYRAPWKRGNESWDGAFTNSPNENYPGSVACDNIAFITGDRLLGPMHTNDELLTCGTPTFGRNAQDRIESGNGYRDGGSSCSGSPTFQGTLVPDSATIGMPATNATLATVASAGGYTFNGPTTITFGTAPGKLSVTNAAASLNNTQMAYPTNGVIFVKNSGTCAPYSALRPSYSSTENPLPVPAGFPPKPDVSGCGDAVIRGTYDTDLTIATANDIIISGDVIRNAGGDSMLGLIADGFVRVEHDTNAFALSTAPSDPNCSNVAAGDRRVDAAILTLLHSFTVDRYYCGNPIGKLSVTGLIAQKFRGAVGKNSGGAVVHGFLKDYQYDPRLAFRSPPHFLDPVKSAWHIHRYTEQEPAAK